MRPSGPSILGNTLLRCVPARIIGIDEGVQISVSSEVFS